MSCEEEKIRICFISGKLGDVDGVSLEVDKWVHVLKNMGHEIFTMAGRYAQPVSGVPSDNQILIKQIDFASEEQRSYETQVFPHLSKNPPFLSDDRLEHVKASLQGKGKELANQMFELIQNHRIDVLVAQNTNAMPMTLLGGFAVYYLATEKRVATIFHHHDFWWERSRFSNNNIRDLLNIIMPPSDLGTEHVVISSYAEHILKSIKRVQPMVIHNCEDFDNPPKLDDYNRDFRKDLGYSDEDILIVQPTRIVPRKRIEDSVALVALFQEKYPELAPRIRFIISLYQGDELDDSYINDIQGMAVRMKVNLELISQRVASVRGKDKQGNKLYTNRDVLIHADLVTYLPIWEGFGNALLEAIAARVPVIITTYLVYKTDIKVCGFNHIEVRDRYDHYGRLIIDNDIVKKMYRALTDRTYRDKMTEGNFNIASREFGYPTLKAKLGEMFDRFQHEILASRNRVSKSMHNYYV
ncbi:MAG: glycosyltransferase family 4 protein [Spirochaetaceae bacterium]|jgi:glycosyltransferase involved in cell wall biosynthesis|nr:glycosyltransferase family 4 protein [Spirochaetaceae bacterium]